MAKNISQVFAANPITSIATSTLVYLGVSGVDGAIQGSNLYNASTSNATFNNVTLVATTNQLVLGTTNTTTISAAAPASSAIYTIPDVGTSANFILSSGTQTIGGSKTFSSALTINPTSNQLILGVTKTTTLSATAPANSVTYTIPDAGTNSSFLMADGAQTVNGRLTLATQLDLVPSTNQIRLGTSGGGGTAITINSALQISGPFTVSFPILSANDTFALLAATQTFSGSKTFSSALTINPTSNQLVLGTTNTATISATAPSSSRTYTIPDPGANANFIMSASNQTLTGVMTYSGQPICSVYKSSTTANQTGNNTAVTVIHDTADINVNTCYNTATGVFTAPVTGTYLFLVNLWFTNSSAVGATSNSAFVINGTSYTMVKRNIGSGYDPANNYSYEASIVQSMSATQTAHIVAQINGFGADNIGLGGDSARTQRLAVIKIA